jgi:hypothetical protein
VVILPYTLSERGQTQWLSYLILCQKEVKLSGYPTLYSVRKRSNSVVTLPYTLSERGQTQWLSYLILCQKDTAGCLKARKLEPQKFVQLMFTQRVLC